MPAARLTFDAGTHRKNSLAARLPICSVAAHSQVLKPHRRAPQARDLTAKARTELPFIHHQTDAR